MNVPLITMKKFYEIECTEHGVILHPSQQVQDGKEARDIFDRHMVTKHGAVNWTDT